MHSLSASLNSWTDPEPSTGDLFYRIAVEKPDPCVPEGGSKKAGTGPYRASLSNLDNNKLKVGENPPDSLYIDNIDIDETRKVAVIGLRIFEEMFDEEEDPIGTNIRVNGVYFTIVGVSKSYRSSNNGGEFDNQVIYLPFTTVQKAFNQGNVVSGGYAITSKPGISAFRRSMVIEKLNSDLASL